MIYKTNYQSPIGNILLASDGKNLVGLWIEKQKYIASSLNTEMVENSDLKVFQDTKNWLERYFSNKKPEITELPLAPAGSDFRKAVWEILCEIPYGKVTTYGEISKKIAKQMKKSTMSAQAIGGAVGLNPISIFIPCHRVIGAIGNLTGYAGGLDLKIKLLEHEGVDLTKMFLPKTAVGRGK